MSNVLYINIGKDNFEKYVLCETIPSLYLWQWHVYQTVIEKGETKPSIPPVSNLIYIEHCLPCLPLLNIDILLNVQTAIKIRNVVKQCLEIT